MSNKPFISVVVTAHDRKEFLLECIKSVIDQDLPRNFYEIIVVKNFKDNDIDRFIEENNIKCFYPESINIGEKFVIGAEQSKGDIISIINDDDKFTSDKLSTVYNIFENEKSLIYYHNSFIEIDKKSIETGRNVKLRNISINRSNIKIELVKKALSNLNTFNDSCISIKKNIILKYRSELKNVAGNQDTILFLLSLLNNGLILLDSKKLTYFRKHNSTSRMLDTDIEISISKFNALVSRRIKSYEGILNLFKNEKYFNMVKCIYMSNKLQLYLFTSKKQKGILKLGIKFIKCPFYSSFITRIILIILIMLKLISNRFVKNYLYKIIFKYY